MWKFRWREEGAEPDYRFSLANERTFLAWIRTALAILAGGLVVDQFALPSSTVLRMVLVYVLVGCSAILSVLGYWRWRQNEIAMRQAQPLPTSPAIPVLAVVLVAACTVTIMFVGGHSS